MTGLERVGLDSLARRRSPPTWSRWTAQGKLDGVDPVGGQHRCRSDRSASLRFSQPFRAPDRTVDARPLRFSTIGICGAAARRPAKNGSRTNAHLPDDAASPCNGNFAGDVVLAAQLVAHQQHKLDQVGRGLLQHVERNGSPASASSTDRRRQRRKIRTWRAVAEIHQFIQVGRAPDLAHLLENAGRLFAVVGAEGAANGCASQSSSRSLRRPGANSSRRRFPGFHRERGQWSWSRCRQSAEFRGRPGRQHREQSPRRPRSQSARRQNH